jgi:hypothetical protein
MNYKLAILLSVIGFLSCKKKEPINTTNPPYVVPYKYISTLNIAQSYSINGSTLSLNSRSATATFYKVETDNPRTFSIPVNIDTVIFNNKVLKTAIVPYMTSFTDTFQVVYPPFTWNIKGSSEFPSFKDTIMDSIPQFTKYNLVPDSVSRTGSTTILLGGTNADSVYITISDGITSGEAWGQILPASVTSTIASNPNWLQVSSSGKFVIQYYKHYFKMVSGKRIDYTVSSTYRKTIKIVP